MKRFLACTLLTTLLVAVPQATAAKDISFNVAPKIGFIATDLRAVQCYETGNILVIFSEFNQTNTYGRVYGVILKHKGDGKYKRGKMQLLSDPAEWAGRPNGIYLASKKMFLVTWDTAGPATGGQKTRIVGQLVKAKNGKPKKGNFDLVVNDHINAAPVPIRIDPPEGGFGVDPAVATGDNTEFALAWVKYIGPGGAVADANNEFGLRLAVGYRSGNVNVKLDPESETQVEPLSFEGGAQLGYVPTHAWALRITFLQNQPVIGGIQGYQQIREGGRFTTRGYSIRYNFDYKPELRADFNLGTKFLLPVDTFAQQGTAIIGDDDDEPILTKGVIADRLNIGFRLHYIEDDTMDEGRVNLYNMARDLPVEPGNIKAASGLDDANYFEPLGLRLSFGPEPSAKPTRGHIIYSTTSGDVSYQRVTDDLDFKRKPKELFRHGNGLQSMTAYRIDLSVPPEGVGLSAKPNNVLILWQKKINDNKHEPWAFITRLK